MIQSLFSPIKLEQLEIKNRIMMSPMCQYQGSNGSPTDWHLVHYGSRAIGGAGLVFMEMTNIEPRGRITENCLGIWSEEQLPKYKEIVKFCKRYNAKIGIQLAHAGRKSQIEGGDIVAPSPIPFSSEYPVPRELEKEEIEDIIHQFGESAKLAVKAGFDTIEIHGGHGYLIHQFLSPISNNRRDIYGEHGRFPVEVIQAVKKNMPEGMPLIMRISGKEYSQKGYDLNYLSQYIPDFIKHGVNIFDVSSGGNEPSRPNVFPGYQIQIGAAIKEKFKVPVIGVGRLENAQVADYVIRNEDVDIVAIGRGMLRNPYWAKEAAEELGVTMELPGEYDLGYSI